MIVDEGRAAWKPVQDVEDELAAIQEKLQEICGEIDFRNAEAQ